MSRGDEESSPSTPRRPRASRLALAKLELLRAVPDVETHLVFSTWARTTIELEMPYTAREVTRLADARRRGLHRAVVSVPDPHDLERKP